MQLLPRATQQSFCAWLVVLFPKGSTPQWLWHSCRWPSSLRFPTRGVSLYVFWVVRILTLPHGQARPCRCPFIAPWVRNLLPCAEVAPRIGHTRQPSGWGTWRLSPRTELTKEGEKDSLSFLNYEQRGFEIAFCLVLTWGTAGLLSLALAFLIFLFPWRTLRRSQRWEKAGYWILPARQSLQPEEGLVNPKRVCASWLSSRSCKSYDLYVQAGTTKRLC